MNDKRQKPLSTEPYKGVRDFYPEDMYVRKYLFDVMRTVVERYGYVEYDASVLEPTELYRAKTGDEIVNEQTYSFTDRGGRDVTLRPEMTPSVARMVAARARDLTFPLRWYSIPNIFRYERPQRGRLREHWQLNADIFGEAGSGADIEIISIARDIMQTFGATDADFTIRINHRALLNAIFSDYLGISNKQADALAKLIDRKAKLPHEAFKNQLTDIVGDKADTVLDCCETQTFDTLLARLPEQFNDMESVAELHNIFSTFSQEGATNVVLDPSLVRGFDYYTGVVFEVFDTNPGNNRSLFGGGRYDRLTEIFGTEPVSAVGFGMGDVTIRDFLQTRNLLPEYHSTADLYLCTTDSSLIGEAHRLAHTLRTKGLKVELNLSDKRVGDQIRIANKKAIPFVVCVGPTELETKQYKVKNLATSEEITVREEEIHEAIQVPKG
ncbi:histidine--tRNA ligase [Candidatus Wolfebacteria bacterium]|nr:histidine--tRNA ligase [Candidatus Wolfebacteria bacterium]